MCGVGVDSECATLQGRQALATYVGTSDMTTESEWRWVSGDSACGFCVMPGGVVTLHVSFAHRPCCRTWCSRRRDGVWPSSVRGHTGGWRLDATRRMETKAEYLGIQRGKIRRDGGIAGTNNAIHYEP